MNDQAPKGMTKKQAEIENNFTYHKPFGTQPARYEGIRSAAKDLANFIEQNTPPSREQSLALTHLEQSVMWANAAIARNEKPAVETSGASEAQCVAGDLQQAGDAGAGTNALAA